MGTSRLNNRDRLYIRIANDGTAIANSALWRNTIPRGQGRWKDITKCVIGCCGTSEPTESSFAIFHNTTGSANFTEISFPGYDWQGTLANGEMMVVPLPFDFNETITITVDSFTGRHITTSTIIGDGVISAIGSITALINTCTVTSTPGSQYLIALS